MKYRSSHLQSRQSGAVLVMSLLMLLVMTVLGLTAMQMTRMEERMAGNSRDVNLAFQGAEAGLRDAEKRINDMDVRPNPCTTPAAPCDVWVKDWLPLNLRDQPEAYWIANADDYGGAGRQVTDVAVRDPLVIIEHAGEVRDSLAADNPEGRDFYRITANSRGATPVAQAVLESTYAARF